MHSLGRIEGFSINTVTRLLEDADKACAAYHDITVRNVKANHVQCDEIWSFCYSKDKNVVLYQQNHHGVWRSGDGGRSWEDVTAGLPSTFGFPIRVHPRDPATIWTLPLNGDMAGRYPPGAAAAVWRSRDAGQSWSDLREGLPQTACFFTVLRQAMAGDRRDPAGVYFGTNSGSIFASRDEGDTWSEIARHLPTILAVEVMDRRDAP